jgi:hypothetical protein
MEVAASLRARGLEVHVVAPEAVRSSARSGPELGGFLKAVHEEHGVRFHLGQRSRPVEPDAVTLSGSDERLTADMVVLGVGVQPSFELARAAGLDDRPRRRRRRSPAHQRAGVFAAGDVRRYPYAPTGEQVRIEHWVVAQRWGGSRRSTCWAATCRSRRRRSSGRRSTTSRFRTSATPRAGIASTCTAIWPRATRRWPTARRADAGGGDRRPRPTSLEAEVAIEAGDQATLAAFGRTR